MAEALTVAAALWVFVGPWGRQVREHWGGTTALELGMAAVLAILIGRRAGWAADEIGTLTLALWPAVYLASCAWLAPFRRCPNPRCSRRKAVAGAGGGIYRRRGTCRVCGGDDYPRLGARLFYRGD